MLTRRFRRSSQRRLLRLALYVVLALLLLDTLTILKHYRQFSTSLLSHTYSDVSTLPSPARDQKIFINAQFWTNAYVIATRWGQALQDLIKTLGPDNVFVSIYESGSLDNTKEILAYLDWQLSGMNVSRTILLDPESHADIINAGPYDQDGRPRQGWVLPPTGSSGKEARRIPYLAKTRNLSLQPLIDEKKKGRTYDKILFLNDVVFKPQDVVSLLATNGGSYSVACAFDYHYPARLATYYDTFALRDTNGDGSLAVQFPYFRAEDSRQAILRGDSARVSSCWNGMALMDAAPFYDSVDDNGKTVEGLRFRGISDSLASKHLEGSECCLVHSDLATMGAAEQGIYINPAVRVGYTEAAYNLTHFGPEQTFISPTQYVLAEWLNRLDRLRTPSAEKQLRKVHKKVEKWKKDSSTSLEKREESGEMCLIDEMHLLIWNGWKHA